MKAVVGDLISQRYRRVIAPPAEQGQGLARPSHDYEDWLPAGGSAWSKTSPSLLAFWNPGSKATDFEVDGNWILIRAQAST